MKRYRVRRICSHDLAYGMCDAALRILYNRGVTKSIYDLMPSGYKLTAQGLFKIEPIQLPTINTLPQ